MKTAVVSADFSRSLKRKIKPLHGVNNSPLSLGEPPIGFREAGFPFCRLHDIGGPFGGAHYVDIPNVFPDFDADPANPEAYDFAFTDALLKQLHAAGTKIFYRLGISIENNYRIKAYRNHPPKNYRKWAEICAGIVRHYNCGWADGFEFDIQYWEIWNEPENPPMWSGTREEYFELYRTASLRLKEEFPEIRIGGYASCGFYAVNRPDCNDFYKGFVTWYDEFLKFVTAEKTACPLDFFSWHLYTNDPEEIVLHARYVDSKLKEFGLTEVENIFNEWNYISGNPKRIFLEMKDNEGASFVGAAFCLMQDSPIEKAMYYDAYPQQLYCGLYTFPGLQTTQTCSVFAMWDQLYRVGGQCETVANGERVYTCAAANRADKAWLITNFNTQSRRVKLTIAGAKLEDFSARIVDRRHDNTVFAISDEIVLGPYATLLLTTVKTARKKTIRKGAGTIHAGLDDTTARKNQR